MADYIYHDQKIDSKNADDYIIKVSNLSKLYNEGLPSKVTALDHVSFGIRKGKMITIYGPSGSGKSSLLNILGCMDSATSGSVLLDDVKITDLSERELADIRKHMVGFVFQEFLLIPTLTAIENVLLPVIPDGITKEDRERALKLLTQVGLKERVKHKPKELSGGEKQRVAIARALMNNPLIIYADEPTGNLDTKNGDEIIQLLRNLNHELGVTVVIVSHDPLVWEKTDYLLKLKDGRIDPQEIAQ